MASKVWKIRDAACDEFYVITLDTEDETDAAAKYEVFRDANLDNPTERVVRHVVLVASGNADEIRLPWPNLVE